MVGRMRGRTSWSARTSSPKPPTTRSRTRSSRSRPRSSKGALVKSEGSDPPCHAAAVRSASMTDDEWHRSHCPPTPPRRPTPGDRIWSLRKNGKQVDCELRFHGESYSGVSVPARRELAYGRRYITRQDALVEA